MQRLINHIIYDFIPKESIIAFLAMAVAVGTTMVLWKYRKSNEVLYLILIEIFAAFWAFTSGMEYLSVNFATKVVWCQISYLGIAFIPLCYFLFTTAFSQKFHLITPLNITLLSIIPFITILLAMTNDYHHLVWKNVQMSSQSYNTLIIEHGIWFWVY